MIKETVWRVIKVINIEKKIRKMKSGSKQIYKEEGAGSEAMT